MSVFATGTTSQKATYKLDADVELAEVKEALAKFRQGAQLMHKRQPTSAEFVAGKRKIYEAEAMCAQIDQMKHDLEVREPEQADMPAQLVDPLRASIFTGADFDPLSAEVVDKKMKLAVAVQVEPVADEKMKEVYVPEPSPAVAVKVEPAAPALNTPGTFMAKVLMSAPAYVAPGVQHAIRLLNAAAGPASVAAPAPGAPKITPQKAETKSQKAEAKSQIPEATPAKSTFVEVVVKTEVFELSSDEDTPSPDVNKAPAGGVSKPAEQLKKSSPVKMEALSDDDEPIKKPSSAKKAAKPVQQRKQPSLAKKEALAQQDGFWASTIYNKMTDLNNMRIYNFQRMTKEVEEALGKLPVQAAARILDELADAIGAPDANAFVLERAQGFSGGDTESERESD